MVKEGKEDHQLKPDFLDYVALTIALLETTLLPFLLVLVAFTVIYLTFLIGTTVGPIWLLALYAPLIVAPVLLKRFFHWRRLEKTKASLR